MPYASYACRWHHAHRTGALSGRLRRFDETTWPVYLCPECDTALGDGGVLVGPPVLMIELREA